MKTDKTAAGLQKQFDFSAPRPRPFLTNLTARMDSYEEGIAHYFHWRTGLDYYVTMDQVVDFVVGTRRVRVVDMQTDTGAFALRLAGRKGFTGRVYSFDANITLLERAKQRAAHLHLDHSIEFRQSEPGRCPVADGFAEIAVSIFDFHRHNAEQFLSEAARVVAPEGHFILAEVLEPVTFWSRSSWAVRRMQLKYLQKNPTEADGIYYDQEKVIDLMFRAGFRQVIIQGLKERKSPHKGIFSLIAATR